MKNYKDETIKALCRMFNCLDDLGCLTEEEIEEYQSIIIKYSEEYNKETYLPTVPYTTHSNCVIIRDREDGEVLIKTYDDDAKETMMCHVSKLICFSDCDDTYEVLHIIYNGREIEYVGWQPGMLYEYRYVETRDSAWMGRFESWDH